MPELLIIFICCVGILFTLLLFGAWLVFTIFRLFAAGVECLFRGKSGQGGRQALVAQQATGGWVCQRTLCRSANPSHARYCRRCGRAVVAEEPVRATVAMARL